MPRAEEKIIRNSLPPNRLEAITDGIFTFVMTLLVLGITVPVFKSNVMRDEFDQLLEMWPRFATYFVTFVMLGQIWSAHHRQSNYFKRTDSLLIWIRIFFLMFTVLVPFSTSLLAEYMGQTLPLLVYEGNIFLIGLIGMIAWIYATGRGRLVDLDIHHFEVKWQKRGHLINLLVIAFSMGVSFVSPIASMLLFLVMTLFLIVSLAVRFRVRGTLITNG